MLIFVIIFVFDKYKYIYMDNKFWKLALAIFYMLFGGITLAFNQNGLKAIIITCGVSLVILGVYIFFFADHNIGVLIALEGGAPDEEQRE